MAKAHTTYKHMQHTILWKHITEILVCVIYTNLIN